MKQWFINCLIGIFIVILVIVVMMAVILVNPRRHSDKDRFSAAVDMTSRLGEPSITVTTKRIGSFDNRVALYRVKVNSKTYLLFRNISNGNMVLILVEEY